MSYFCSRMGKKRKLFKFSKIDENPLVFQQVHWESTSLRRQGEEKEMPGKWSEFFGNSNPIVLELACGYGEYTIGMSAQDPNTNFIGIDIKGDRIYMGAKKALEEDRKNAAFLRGSIVNLDRFFAKEEIAEIWIIFPDPYLPQRQSKKRLTAPRFLEIYGNVLAKDGVVHLKTDSGPLFEFTHEMIAEHKCDVLESNLDIYKNGFEEEYLKIRTRFEKSHLADNRTIKYLKWKLP